MEKQLQLLMKLAALSVCRWSYIINSTHTLQSCWIHDFYVFPSLVRISIEALKWSFEITKHGTLTKLLCLVLVKPSPTRFSVQRLFYVSKILLCVESAVQQGTSRHINWRLVLIRTMIKCWKLHVILNMHVNFLLWWPHSVIFWYIRCFLIRITNNSVYPFNTWEINSPLVSTVWWAGSVSIFGWIYPWWRDFERPSQICIA